MTSLAFLHGKNISFILGIRERRGVTRPQVWAYRENEQRASEN